MALNWSGHKPERFAELDGLRAVAVLIVVMGHLTVTYDDLYGTHFGWPTVLGDGRFGVQLFFLVSGFVILMSVQRVRRVSDFAISRFSRLFPAYWIAVTWSILVAVVLHPRDVTYSWFDRLANYSMVQRFLGFGAVDSVYWTLAIELQFYALMLVALWVTRCRLRNRHIVAMSAAWVVVTTVLAVALGQYSRGHAASETPRMYKLIFNLSLTEYAPLFCAGMLTYLSRSGRRWAKYPAVACSFAAVAQGYLMHGMTTAIPIAIICLFFHLVCAMRGVRFLRVSAVQWVGRRSYSLYLVHNVSGQTLVHLLSPVVGRICAVCLALLLCLALAHVLYEVGEVRATRAVRRGLVRLRDRFLPADGFHANAMGQ